jgi:hypothetical protein
MAKTIGEKMSQMGESVKQAASKVAETISEGAEKTVDMIKDATGMDDEGSNVGVSGITEHMDVIASCGKKIGVVDRVEGNSIKLTRKDSPDNQHHNIPKSWVARVDRHVHLNVNSKEATQDWNCNSSASDSSCGCA